MVVSIVFPDPSVSEDILNLDIPLSTVVGDVKLAVANNLGRPNALVHLFFGGSMLLDDNLSLERVGVKDDAVISAEVYTRTSPRNADTETIRLQLSGDANARSLLASRSPELARALDDPAEFRRIFERQRQLEDASKQQREAEFNKLNENIMDPESQKKIEDMIKHHNIQENLQYALNFSPESFGRVSMLYIDAEVNGHKVKAFVDSGAQATLLSQKCAEACDLARLIDTRYAGTAIGIGTAKIIGRIHSGDIKIGSSFYQCTFTVMEGNSVDLLFGLDMLKRHQGIIDLKRNKLCFAENEVSFLGEADIPKHNETAIQIPGKARIPAQTGTFPATGPAPGPSSGPASTTPQAPSASAPAQSASGPRPSSQHANISKESVSTLMDMGFSEAQALGALQVANGDIEQAAAILWAD